MAHTKGPWKVYSGSHKDPCESEVITDENGKAGCVVICRGSGFNHEDNARLIASAPDLLEACKRLMPWIGKAIADGAFDACVAPNGAMASLQYAEHIVAKADGR